MRLVLDVENTTVKRDGKMLLDPFEPGLELVQVGTQNVDNPEETNIYPHHMLSCCKHSSSQPTHTCSHPPRS